MNLAAAGIAARMSAVATSVRAAAGSTIGAIAFDGFPILDLRPILALAEQLFSGRRTVLGSAWRTRKYECHWLRALSGQHADSWQTTEAALVPAAESPRLEMTADKHRRLMNACLDLRVWPDVVLALESFRREGSQLAYLSNTSPGTQPRPESEAPDLAVSSVTF